MPDILNTIDNTFEQKMSVKVYPNPASAQFRIDILTGEAYQIKIYSPLGKEVYAGRENRGSTHFISTNGFARGLYYLVVNSSSSLMTKKIAIQ